MKMSSLPRFALAAIAAALLSDRLSPAQAADEEIQQHIRELTQKIQKDPRQPNLFVQRGELFFADADWDGALADFEYAGILNPKLATLDLLRGRVFAGAKWWRVAKGCLDRFLLVQTNHAEALILRGRVLVQLGQRLAAVQDLTRALATDPRPDLFIERAQYLEAEGEAHYAPALEGVEEGIKKLGPLITLEVTALDLELKQKKVEAALTRVDALTTQANRKESWLARRGDILRDAGRPDEARTAYQGALAALDKVPPVRRNVPAMQELEKQIRASLQALGAPK
jgi:tetratricopeptide (TPR) repeat protein